MQTGKQHAKIDETKRGTEYLANERTFLAWIRTSIAVVSLGFVLARFSIWLRELSMQREPQIQVRHGGVSHWIGLGMMAFGGILALFAARRYHVVNSDIERGEVNADRGLVTLVAAVIIVLSAAMIAFVLLTVS